MFTTINIRGTKFDVNNDTLEKMSYFKALLSSRWSSNDCVIDRCPESFRRIIDFLVYDNMVLDVNHENTGKSENMRSKIISDSCYYGVGGIADFCSSNVPLVGGNFSDVRVSSPSLDILRLSLIGDNPKICNGFIVQMTRLGNGKVDLSRLEASYIIEYAVQHDGRFSMWDFLNDKCGAPSEACCEKRRRCFLVDGVNPCATVCSRKCIV